jgi:hypothetical protein
MKSSGLVTLILLLFTSFLAAQSEVTPRIQPLVPGIRIQQLPVRLPNINSLDYGPDERLYAAGYDGRVHVLIDSDGDGTEDSSRIFWDQPGDLLTPVGIQATQDGLYLAVRGKIALLKDTDWDGEADVSEELSPPVCAL